MNSVNISNKTILKLILQFLLENGLFNSYFTLSEECGVNLNWVNNLNNIKSIISEGLWSELIKILRYIKLPVHLQVLLFEHIILELLELKEPFVAQYFIENNKSVFLYDKFIEKYNALLEYIEKSKNIISKSENDSYDSDYSQILNFVKNSYIEGGSKEKSRERLSKLISDNLVEIKNSILLEVIGDYLKYKNSLKLNNEEQGTTLDLESNGDLLLLGQGRLQLGDQGELKFVERSSVVMDTEKFGYISCVAFSPSGEQIVATSKGYVIIGSAGFCNKEHNLVYSKHIYSHCKEYVKILSMCVTSLDRIDNHKSGLETDSEHSESILIASTSERGDIRIWDYSKSDFIFIVNNAHEKYITDLTFNKDATCILSSSIEGTIKIHGLKSGRTIKYFPKNSDFFVNKISYNNSETMVISALSNGSVNVWDIKTSSCIAVYDICPSQILEMKLINHFDITFSMQTAESMKKSIKTIDSFVIGSRSGMYIVDISNGKVMNLTLAENIKQDLSSVTYNSKLNMIICLLKSSKIMLYDVKNQNTSRKEISLDNSYEYEQVVADKSSGSITVCGKNKLVTFINE